MAGARAGRSGQRAGFGGAAAPPGQAAQPAPDGPTVTLPAQPAREAPAAEAPREARREAPGDPAGTAAGTGDGEFDDEDPPDEPAPQVVSAADTARVARLSVDVLVIDGRPRYHLPGCVHLLGRESEPLPVGEAVELEFTPCSLCEPASALLTDPRRG
jgi:hypothetical protein